MRPLEQWVPVLAVLVPRDPCGSDMLSWWDEAGPAGKGLIIGSLILLHPCGEQWDASASVVRPLLAGAVLKK